MKRAAFAGFAGGRSTEATPWCVLPWPVRCAHRACHHGQLQLLSGCIALMLQLLHLDFCITLEAAVLSGHLTKAHRASRGAAMLKDGQDDHGHT